MVIRKKGKNRMLLDVNNTEAEMIAMWIQFGVQNTQIQDPDLPRQFMNFAENIIAVSHGELDWEITDFTNKDDLLDEDIKEEDNPTE